MKTQNEIRTRSGLPMALVVCAALSIAVATAAQDDFNSKGFQAYQNDASSSVKRFEDRQKIETVLKQYIVAMDTNDESLYMDVFAARDAVFEIRDVTRRGREEIRKEINAATATKSFHMMSNSHIVFVDSTHALHNAYYQVWTRENPSPGGVVRLTTPITLVAIGRYDDELVKIDGKWRIQRRRVTPDTPGGF